MWHTCTVYKNVKSEHTKFFQSKFKYVVLCIIRAADNNLDGHHFAKEWVQPISYIDDSIGFEIHLLYKGAWACE